MCARSMIAAPLLPPMSFSAAPFGPRNQSYQREHNFWDPLTTHNPGSMLGHGPGRRNGTGMHGPQQLPQARDNINNGYVARWIADAAAQTSRARSVPAVQQSINETSSSLSYNPPPKNLNGLEPSLDRLALQSYGSNARPPSGRIHRSMSPEAASRRHQRARRNSTDAAKEAIASYLQIPSSINATKGSLADLAAEITCLFWFENVSVLNRIEDAVGSPKVTPLSHEATPAVGFRKWVTTLLSTTQVSQNVILLALLFIYRLKKITMNVQGKVGSEYRLLTVALMLGNKFLDDNTYTNKTWADVSGISVSEIHVMEVEFLSNMKYNLFTSDQQWEVWHRLLGKFAAYFEQASSMFPLTQTSFNTSNPLPGLPGNPILPFTPPSEQLSPPLATTQHGLVPQRQLPTPVTSFATSAFPPTAHRLPEIDMKSNELRGAGSRPVSRKRSYDLGTWEPPQKVIKTSGLGQDITSALSSTAATPEPMYPRLPIPAPMPTSATFGGYMPSYHNQVNTPLSAGPGPLPASALMPSRDSMWSQSPGVSQPPQSISSMATGVSSLPNLFTHHPSTPFHARTETQGMSPGTPSFHTTPQQTQSPSKYLWYRNSPYRPVRTVNTLLAPPPSASVQNPLLHMSQQNTYYQTLAKVPMEPRQGMLPHDTPRDFQMAPVFDQSRPIPSFDYRHLLGPRQ